MNEGNEQFLKEGSTRKGRRKGAAWKSGLVLTGLGAVVLGAGYLAGVNAPAVAQGASAQAAASQSLTQAPQPTPAEQAAGQQAPAASTGSEEQEQEGQVIGFDENGNPVILREDGSLQFGNGSTSGQQFGARRSRQFGGFSQQAPSFSGPVTRSRGS